jgi:hypothetical protein
LNLLDAAIKAAEQLRLAVLVIAQEGVCVLQELIFLWRAARHILQSDQSYEELVDGIVTLQCTDVVIDYAYQLFDPLICVFIHCGWISSSLTLFDGCFENRELVLYCL